MINGIKIRGTALLLLVVGIAAGCWYYSTSGSLLPSHIKSVAVPLFGNETTWEYGIKEKLTDAVIDAFAGDNTLRVESERNADSILRASIVSIKEVPFTYDQQEQVQEYKMQIFLTVRFEDVRERKVIWEDNAMEGWGIYSTGDEEWEDGIDRAIEKLASDIVNKTVAGW
ncbi:MAG: LptE family protein [Gemmatimonadota bacterium]|nr:MAG: LptE family protein [Gemmatimonadota bacterium]